MVERYVVTPFYLSSTNALAYRSTGLNDYMRQAGWVSRAGSFFKNELARQNEPTHFQLNSIVKKFQQSLLLTVALFLK